MPAVSRRPPSVDLCRGAPAPCDLAVHRVRLADDLDRLTEAATCRAASAPCLPKRPSPPWPDGERRTGSGQPRAGSGAVVPRAASAAAAPGQVARPSADQR